MMRKVFSVVLMAAMVCLAGTAGAAVTMSLVWDSTTGGGVGVGTDTITALPGDTIVLHVRLTNDEVLSAHGISLAFDADLVNELNIVGFGSWAGSSFGAAAMATVYGAIGVSPGGTTESTGAVAGEIENWNGGILSGPLFLPVGTYTIGTVAFVVTANVASDGFDMATFIDPLLGGFGGSAFAPIPASNTTMDTATVNVIPEPGTVSLLGLGLVGLVLAGRRSRRS
jgi:hypothetical protein